MPIRIFRGDTLNYTTTLKEEDGTTVVLTSNDYIRLYARDMAGNSVIEATTKNGQIIINEDNSLTINIKYILMEDIKEGIYDYDIEVTFENGTRKTYEKDILIITKDVSYD